MDLHGGKITVSSGGLGNGSTFTVDIVTVDNGIRNETLTPPVGGPPMVRLMGEPSMRPPRSQRSSAQVVPLSISNPTPQRCLETRASISTPRLTAAAQLAVLVVDDSSLNRNMLCRTLKAFFVIAGEVESGGAAVSFIASQMARGEALVDAIIMDYRMPGMDGPTAAKAIRGMGYNRVIVGVTGNVLAEDMNHFITCGANAVMMKPVDPDALAQRILGECGGQLTAIKEFLLEP